MRYDYVSLSTFYVQYQFSGVILLCNHYCVINAYVLYIVKQAVIECCNEQQLVSQVIEKAEQSRVNQCGTMCNIMFSYVLLV